MILQRLLQKWPLVLAAAALALCGCSSPMSGPAGKTAVVDSYYFFLKSQYDELQRREESAIQSIEKAAIAGNSSYLELEAARLLSRSGRVAEAEAHVERSLELDPQSSDARLFAAWLSAATGQWPKAEAHYLAILKADPHNEEALSYLGALYAENGKVDEAKKTFIELKASAPNSHLPDYYLGILAQKTGFSKEAIGHFKNSLKKNPKFVSALNELAVIYEQEGRAGEAERAYRQLIRLRPDAAVPKARLSRILLKTGRRQEAVDLLKRMGDLSPDTANAGLMVALAFLEEGMVADAEKELELMLEKFPDNSEILFLLASIKSERGQAAAAKGLLGKIPPESQQFVDSRLFLATVMIEDNDRAGALAMLAKSRGQAPWSPQLVLAEASILEEDQRYQEAQKIYKASLKSFPDMAEIRFRLGFVEDKLGNRQECLKSMSKAVELDPNHAEALNYLAYTWAEMGENLDQALAMAIKADQIKPENGYIVDTLAWIYYAMGDLKKALPLLERAVKLSNQDPVILEHLGDALAGLGHRDEAKKAYSLALEKGHENPGAVNAKLLKISQ
jgi:tetratricopeptide (TPR) repeat protein